MKTTQLNQYNFQRIALLILALVAAALYFRSCSNPSLQVAQQTKDVSDKKIDLSQVQIWKDKYNNEHFKSERLQVDKAVLQVHSDSLAKLLKIKSKQIQSYSFIKSGISIDKPLTTQTLTDTIYIDNTKQVVEYKTFAYNDKWIDIKGEVGRNDQIHISGSDTLTRVDYWKRKWALGKKHYYSDFSNKNPYIKIQGLKLVESIVDKKRFSIGPYVGVGYQFDDLSTPKIQFGLSVQYGLIQF